MYTRNDFRTLATLNALNGYSPATKETEPKIAEDGWAMELPAGWGCMDGLTLVKESVPECSMAVESAFQDGCGNYLCTDRRVMFDGDISAALIPGLAFAEAEDGVVETVPTAIALTRNCGFQHVGIDDSGRAIAEVPLSTPVIVGGTGQPSAVIVPFNSAEALKNGRKFIDAMIESYNDAEDMFLDHHLDTLPGPVPKGDLNKAERIKVIHF